MVLPLGAVVREVLLDEVDEVESSLVELDEELALELEEELLVEPVLTVALELGSAPEVEEEPDEPPKGPEPKEPEPEEPGV